MNKNCYGVCLCKVSEFSINERYASYQSLLDSSVEKKARKDKTSQLCDV